MKCRGIEIAPNEFSGCDTQQGALRDCPTCHGCGIEVQELVDALSRVAMECRLDRDYVLAERIEDASRVISYYRTGRTILSIGDNV